MTLTDYPCDECGFKGPHLDVDSEDAGAIIYECGDCGAEFTVSLPDPDSAI